MPLDAGMLPLEFAGSEGATRTPPCGKAVAETTGLEDPTRTPPTSGDVVAVLFEPPPVPVGPVAVLADADGATLMPPSGNAVADTAGVEAPVLTPPTSGVGLVGAVAAGAA